MRPEFSFLKSAAVLLGVAVMTSTAAAGPQTISWSALRRADQDKTGLPLPGMASSREQGETLAWQDKDRTVTLTGFILPIDQDGDLVYEFMLVPWAGACAHSAPPPPNQLVHVSSDEPFHLSRIYEVITVTGALRPGLDKTQLFIMDGTRVLDYGYSVSHAQVAKATDIADPDLRSISPLGILAR